MSPAYWLALWVVLGVVLGFAVGFWSGVMAGESAAYYHLYGEGLTEEANGTALDGPRRI